MCGQGWSPPACTRGHGDTHAPRATRSWCKREGETLNPQLCPCAAAHGRDTLGGVEGLGIPAKRGWCHTKSIFPIASSAATLPFIPGLSKPSRMPCCAALCLRPATHGHATATLRQGIRVSQAD